MIKQNGPWAEVDANRLNDREPEGAHAGGGPVWGRVGVSKEMARFRREGLIEPRGKGRIVLLDKLRLKEIVRNRVV